MKKTTHPCLKSRLRAFTLIELTIVILIIMLLGGLLLPVLGKARMAARTTDTTSEMRAIAMGCETYYQIFGDYPGPISEDTVAANSGWISGTQNLMLGLMGTVYSPASLPTNISYPAVFNLSNPNCFSLSTAPADSFTVAMKVDPAAASGYSYYPMGVVDRARKTYPTFWSATTGDLQTFSSTALGGGNGALVTLPTITDRYQDRLPILYYRKKPATRAAMYPVDDYPRTGTFSDGYFSLCVNSAYTAGTIMASPTNLPCYQAYSATQQKTPSGLSYTGANGCKSLAYMVTNSSISDWSSSGPNAATSKILGGFVLISAGPDRVYGPRGTNAAGPVNSSSTDDVVITGGSN